ncbi:MFS transporter [Desulfohalobium retbaense]|uniref:Major facilitator superfamily MFS_1 n=1 Tax=Desulfohalobium retbaense (strain ATCC 49708 / DSM 5692 / JCM 16813 / HR100) TaxID=485915 RepID=C8WZ60_DESRD|nr:MFS transporter [Desulfohalobium retbaense]ACV67335.1 major facilitator superfamily MFS_1 [Desulfohalobium retbaense DSM 5692]
MSISPSPAQPQFTRLVGPLVLISTIFFLNFISRVALGPVLLPLQEDLGISLSRTGLIFLTLQAGYSVALLNAGWVSSRLTHRRTILLSIWAIGAGWICVGLSPSFPVMLACLFATGLGGGLYLPSGVASITDITPSCHWGKGFAIHEMAPSLSFILAPLLVEALLFLGSWRLVYIVLGLSCFVVGAIYRKHSTAGRFSGQPPRLKALRAILTRPAFWAMTLFFVLVVGGEIGVYNLAPAYLVKSHGIPREWANFILSASRLLSLGTAFGAGWCIDKLGLKRSLTVILSAGGLATIGFAWGSSLWVAAMLVLQPIFLVAYFPAGFSALTSISEDKQNDLTVSLTVTSASLLGAGGIPALLAYLGEHVSFSLGFTGLGVCLAASALLVPFLDFRNAAAVQEGQECRHTEGG